MDTLADAANVHLNESNFEHAFRPIYYFSHLAGLWSFSIIRDSSGKIQRARMNFFAISWSILFICLNLTLAFSTYVKLKAGLEKIEDQLRFIVLNTFLMISLLCGVFGIVSDVVNRHNLVDILIKFNTFDSEVRLVFRDFFPIQMNYVNSKFYFNKNRYRNSVFTSIIIVPIDVVG